MKFYDVLSEYYDDIFKLNQNTVDMILENIKGKKVLDLACGTGNYSIALDAAGKKVTGIDLDSIMIEKAKKKNHNILFKQGNMLSLAESIGEEKFDGVFCIGNSIVHLNNLYEIGKVFQDVYNHLNVGGKFIVQIINYDRILGENIKGLPSIKTDDVIFNRHYILKENKIIFRGEIETKEEKFINEVELFPLLRKDTEIILEKVGFKDFELYGAFNGEEYNKGSFNLIVCATK
ncbi:class I SAM-dependent DNA methyltransferase [Inconstantimicrobium mannanitabidum]|uniref:SAM-dependent methyltransferase n=1 Tax=Inconstantimicrobium mannanitabidum TaxID=1604901 RepID=A0ACB5RCF3_9CLOT|nr:class I SAM-dependent methyltransferase [Clostridium sp. TW13]GKX66923.1 SAM-dependent methyltransferase [Clostridium sp. TW13]